MDDRIWRAELACAAAWPAQEAVRVGDWIACTSGGPTRRVNSASPARIGAALSADDLIAIDAVYRAARQPTILRVPTFASGADAVLDAAGFAPGESPTRTILADIGPIAGGAILDDHAGPAWLATRARLAPAVPADAMAATIRRIAAPIAFAHRSVDGVGAAVAYGVIAQDMLVIEAVATDPALRRRGLARECVATLMAWAYAQGVMQACLQVVADNAGAIALYEGLGFRTHLYDYHYRRRPRREGEA